MEDERKNWELKEGVKFLREIGIRAGQRVLDFGARVGRYSIPAAIVVGNKGLICAVDKEQRALNELSRKATTLGLGNIKLIQNSGEARLDFKSESIDVVLLYDVLHFLRGGERKILYNEAYRILKPKALLSVYPKHVLEDNPLDEFRQLHLEDVKQEIKDSAFIFRDRYCGMISHDDTLNQGCVLNFSKSK